MAVRHNELWFRTHERGHAKELQATLFAEVGMPVKPSGIGRELGRAGFEEYTEIKAMAEGAG